MERLVSGSLPIPKKSRRNQREEEEYAERVIAKIPCVDVVFGRNNNGGSSVIFLGRITITAKSPATLLGATCPLALSWRSD